MKDDDDQGLRALAKRFGLDPSGIDPNRVMAHILSSDQSPDDGDAFDSPAGGDPDQDQEAEAEADDPDDDDDDDDDDSDDDGPAGTDSDDGVEAGAVSLEAQATGTIDIDDPIGDDQVIDLEAADGSALTGIVWGAGDHNLALGGKPTPVRVPPETVPDTFERLKDDLQAGDVTIGFDHPDPDSVAAQTGIVDIGTATAAALSADDQFIVLTDSELQNEQAIQAAERGDFDDLDWSIVADVAVRRDDGGQPVTEDGRVLLDATRIRRIDAVDDGAVDQASIERSQAALPDLSDEVSLVQEAAEAGLEEIGTDAVVQALQASATAYKDIEQMQGSDFDPDDFDDIEAARNQLSAAADVIDTQEQELNAAKAQADAFDGLLAAHDVDAEDFEDPAEAAQAVIDEQTEDTRRDIAQMEANLAAFDTDEDSIDDRTEALAGKSPTELQNVLNARKAKAFEVQQAEASRGAAAAQVDQTGEASFAGGQNGNDGQADEIALQAMDGADRIQATASGQDPADFVQDQYGLNAAEFDGADELHDAIMASMDGDA